MDITGDDYVCINCLISCLEWLECNTDVTTLYFFHFQEEELGSHVLSLLRDRITRPLLPFGESGEWTGHCTRRYPRHDPHIWRYDATSRVLMLLCTTWLPYQYESRWCSYCTSDRCKKVEVQDNLVLSTELIT